MTARLLLVCHASTEATRTAAFPADEPLEDNARMRAAALAGGLPRADRHWSSPELRTRQTAEALGLDAAIQPMLRECDYGRWTGITIDAAQAREPEAVASWLHDLSATPHGGESILDLMDRVASWLAAEQANQGRSIVVTHPTVIRAAIVHAIEAAPQSFWRIDVAPLSMTRLSGARGRWNLSAAGCTAIWNSD
jgi:broad specificity phosphatase PhoE